MEFFNEEELSRTLEGASSLSPFEGLKRQVEAILFAAEHAMEVSDIRNIIGEVSLSDVRLALRDLMADYQPRSFFLFECGGKYQLRTRPEFAELVRKQFVSKPRSLSKSALETLAIVAYRQPVTRSEVNTIRQVDSSSIMTALKEKDLIAVAGQRKEVGSPMEYKTTQRFLETFGLKSLSDLPSLRSLQMKTEDQEQMAQALASLNNETPDEEPELTAQDLSFQDPIEPQPFEPSGAEVNSGVEGDPVGWAATEEQPETEPLQLSPAPVAEAEENHDISDLNPDLSINTEESETLV